jgi:hypothetical protein
MTDDARWYRKIAKAFAGHQAVNHSGGEYVRGDAYTNSIEGFFSVFKRGMNGVYQHCDSARLHRYLSGFGFRYNNRIALEIDHKHRAEKIVPSIVGKRLTYQTAKE